MPTAQATFMGNTPPRGRRPASSPATRTTRASPSVSTLTSASADAAEQRTTRSPGCPSTTRRTRGSSQLATTVRAPSRISALARAMASSEPKRSRCTGPTAVITAMSGGIQRQRSAISPGP